MPNKNMVSFAGTDNYFYDATYKGEPEYFENKFLRFSYRFQYDDDEYSLIAPFSQACFIPQQDGFFIKRRKNVMEGERGEEGSGKKNLVTFFVHPPLFYGIL